LYGSIIRDFSRPRSFFSVKHEKIKSCFKASPFTRDSYLWLMNRAVSFCLRDFRFSEHYAQIGSSLLAVAMRFRKSRSLRHILCANKSQVYPAIKTFHGKTNKFLSKRCYIWRKIRNVTIAIAVHINKKTIASSLPIHNVRLYGLLIAAWLVQFFLMRSVSV